MVFRITSFATAGEQGVNSGLMMPFRSGFTSTSAPDFCEATPLRVVEALVDPLTTLRPLDRSDPWTSWKPGIVLRRTP